MTIKQVITLFGVIISLCACYSPNQQAYNKNIKALTLIDSVTYNVPFSYSPNHTAPFYSAETNQELHYFADLTTQKRIVFFDQLGELLFDINLKNGVDSLQGSVQDVEVISLDTILLIAPYSNLIVVLNRQGDVWKKIDLNRVLKLNSDSIQSYELQNSISNHSALIDHNNMVLFVSTLLHSSKFKSRSDWILANKANSWKSNQFIRINDLFSDSIHHLFGGKLYQSISPEDSNAYIIDLFNHFLVTSNTIYATNLFSNKLFFLDAKTLSITNTKTIESNYGPLGIPILSSSDIEENRKVGKEVSVHLKARGKLGSVHYNSTRKHFYVSASIDKTSEYKGNWSLMVFDNEFNKLNEYLINPEEYLGPLVISEKGFMLKKARESKDYFNQEVMMHEFTY